MAECIDLKSLLWQYILPIGQPYVLDHMPCPGFVSLNATRSDILCQSLEPYLVGKRDDFGIPPQCEIMDGVTLNPCPYAAIIHCETKEAFERFAKLVVVDYKPFVNEWNDICERKFRLQKILSTIWHIREPQ